MADNGRTDVVSRLLKATRSGYVRWHVSSPTIYQVRLGTALVTIEPKDGDGVAPFILHIADERESKITIDYTMSREAWNEADNLRMFDLYQAASQSAVESSPGVRAVLNALDELEAPPF